MRQWAISVGINQYQFFQPLSYAQHDAQAMQQFLVEDVGIPAEQCLLLTETSPPQWGKSTYPDRETIQSWLDLLVQRYIEPGDVLWCFLSGYGVCQQGQDYFVPIEGNPTAIPATAIPLEAIFRSLRQVSDATVLVLLDINRNESSSYEAVGTHTTHLASITGIPTLLSCQPGQFSRETSALGHGFFTAALLESLRDRRYTTLSAVGQYLGDRLPELSEHYWRPIQQAVMICPDEKLAQPLLPLPGVTTEETYQRVDHPVVPHPVAAHVSPRQNGAAMATGSFAARAVNGSLGERTPHTFSSATNGTGLGTPALPHGQPVESTNRAIAASGIHAADGAASRSSHGSTHGSHTHPVSASDGLPNGLKNGFSNSGNGLVSGSSQFSSTATNGSQADLPLDSATQNHENRVAQPVQVPPVSQPPSDQAEDANEIPDALFWRPMLLWGGLVAVGLILGVLLRNCASFTPKAPAAQQSSVGATRPAPSATQQSGGAPAPTPAANTALPTAPSSATAAKASPSQPIAAAQAFGASGASRLDPAIAGKPKTIAATQPTPANGTAIASSAVGSPLAKAKALVPVNSDQASPYWYAIQEASKIKHGQPDYEPAKQEIALWSREMLRIANKRAKQGRYDAAIVAAKLMPQDQPGYTKAKASISSWCQSLDNQRNVNPVQRRQARTACRSLG